MSLNPFTAQRKKREEKLEEKLSELRALQEAPPAQSQPASSFSPSSFSSKENDYEAEDFSKYLPASSQVEQSPPVWQTQPGKYYEPPSRARQCFSKIQSAFMIGGALGGAVGFLYGSYVAIKARNVIYLPIAVLQIGGAFGFFLGCGTVIRCDERKAVKIDDTCN
eukprot:scaffold12266_cov27-Tisochrysis_lutea.AAC.1